MFGWFDPKHFGWLSRFMEKTPIFPIPGTGRYMRQPLYNRDFCRVIIHCLENQPINKVYDLVGQEQIDYIDIIYAIKRIKKCAIEIIPQK
jgi:nucleoside-diphosphate-sugar epimerase